MNYPSENAMEPISFHCWKWAQNCFQSVNSILFPISGILRSVQEKILKLNNYRKPGTSGIDKLFVLMVYKTPEFSSIWVGQFILKQKYEITAKHSQIT